MLEKIMIFLLIACSASIFTVTRLNKQHPLISVYWVLVWLYWIARSILLAEG